MSVPYQKAYFLLSVAETKQFPPDLGIEVAMVGRSNAGKSSVLNVLTNHTGLARTSKQPGRTQLVNLFALDHQRRLADLPGYGYAKAPSAAKQKWQKIVDAYMGTRQCLKGVLLIMDIRHPLKPLDKHLIDYCAGRHLAVHILLNKADKLSKSQANLTLQTVTTALSQQGLKDVTAQLFSALKKTGLKELYQILNQWYEY